MRRHPSYPDNGGPYRVVTDLSHPWIASPPGNSTAQISQAESLFQRIEKSAYSGTDSTVASVHKNLDYGFRKKKTRGCLLRYLKTIFSPIEDYETIPEYSENETVEKPPMKITPAEWRAWGYWSRPIVNHVTVNNYSPGPIYASPTGADISKVFESLRDPDGTEHPERWIPGIEHPALPPRPTAWIQPRPGDPNPFPWECQVNPFFEHVVWGQTPLLWNIGLSKFYILFGYVSSEYDANNLRHADFAQPATWPLVTHLEISAVADETTAQFPWPVNANNPRGVKCEDLFDAMHDNFRAYVKREEYDRWPSFRKDLSSYAYYRRVKQRPSDGPGMRRIDYMGDRVMFRGMVPSPRQDGTWMMYLGPPY